MVRRILAATLVCVVALLALPPIWYALFPPAATPELPPPGRRVEVAPGVSVNVLEAGEGPAVVVVHGHPGTAYDWVPFQETLSSLGRRVIAYDRVGYGRSDARPDDDYTLDANATELVALLDALDLRGVTLVGWSYGGGTSIVAARKDASRISRLVLVGSIGPGIVEAREVVPQWLADLLLPPFAAWVRGVPPVEDRLGEAAVRAAFAPETPTAGYRQIAAANFALPHTFESTRSEARDFRTPGLLDPGDLELPVLVIHGDGDLLSPPRVGRALHERAKHSELWIVRGGGHMLPLTRTRALAERVAAFGAG